MRLLQTLCLVALPCIELSSRPIAVPGAPSEVRRSYTLVCTRTLESLELTVEGRSVEARVPDAYREQYRIEREIIFVDEVDESEVVHRSFQGLTADGLLCRAGPVFEETEGSFSAECALQDRRIHFEDDEEVEFADDGPQTTELLDDLECDVDLHELTPPEDAEVGTSWAAPAEMLRRILSPGGQPIGGMDDGVDEIPGWPLPAPFKHAVVGELDGEFTVTLAGLELQDGAEVATLEIEGTVIAELDRGVDLEHALGRSNRLMDTGLEFDVRSAEDRLEIEGSGEALWDVEHGRLLQLEWTSTSRLSRRDEITISLGGGGETEERHAEFVGTDEATLTWEWPEED